MEGVVGRLRHDDHSQRHSGSRRRGAITTVIGPNGAGKSTVFKTIFGLLRRAQRAYRPRRPGCDRRQPQRADRPRRLLRAAGAQHLSRTLGAPQSRARRRGARDCGRDAPARWRRRSIAFRCCAQRARTQASTLSGGQQKLLEIARGLLARPQADADRRTLDRPFADHGPGRRSPLLQALKRKGRRPSMVEQNARSALEISDYGLVLELGRTRIAAPRERSSTIRAWRSCSSAPRWR